MLNFFLKYDFKIGISVFAILISIKAFAISWAFDVSEMVKLELPINAIDPNALTLNLYGFFFAKFLFPFLDTDFDEFGSF